jgi:hypothetical protein
MPSGTTGCSRGCAEGGIAAGESSHDKDIFYSCLFIFGDLVNPAIQRRDRVSPACFQYCNLVAAETCWRWLTA